MISPKIMSISAILAKKSNIKRFKQMKKVQDNLTLEERMQEFMALNGAQYILPYLDKLDKAKLCKGK